MTITFPHESNDHHVRQTAIAVTLVVILTAAGLTFWQGVSVGGGGTNASVETAAVETFSPEKARANAFVQAAAVETFSPEKARANAFVATPAAEQRQALESSLPSGAAASIGTATRGNGHPDIHTATPPTSASVRVSRAATAASFAAFDAPDELKEYALTQATTDSVVDYAEAVQFLRTFAKWNLLEPTQSPVVETQRNALDELPTNCSYWGICIPE